MYLYPSIHTTEPNRDVSPSTCPVMHSFGSRNWVLPSLNTLSQLCSIVFLHIRMGLSKNVHKKPSVWTVSVGRTRELLTDTAQREVHFPGCSFSPGSHLDHTLCPGPSVGWPSAPLERWHCYLLSPWLCLGNPPWIPSGCQRLQRIQDKQTVHKPIRHRPNEYCRPLYKYKIRDREAKKNKVMIKVKE